MQAAYLRALERPSGSEPRERSTQGAPVQLACSVTLQKYSGGKLSFVEDKIAVESDMRLQINGQHHAILSRTPGDDLNLVAGYLFSCSMIREPEDIKNISFSYHGTAKVDVTLTAPSSVRRLYPSPCPMHLDPERIFEFKETFERRQNLFKNTGSTHAAALFSADGELIAFGEDVGRHNAFDKAVGRALLEGTLGQTAIAMLSSRLGLELTTKASNANIPILCGFSAATSCAVNYAERYNITLVGRIRNGAFYVYSNGWRLRK